MTQISELRSQFPMMPPFGSLIGAFIFISLIIGSCKPEKKKPPIENIKTQFLWKKQLVEEDTVWVGAIADFPVFLHDDELVVYVLDTVSGKGAPISFLSADSGTVLESWNDFIRNRGVWGMHDLNQNNPFLVMNSHLSVDVLNLETRQRQWATAIQNYGLNNYILDDYVYVGFGHSNSKIAGITRSPLDHEDWETVFVDTSQLYQSIHFYAMAISDLPNGDQVLVWKSRSEGWSMKVNTDIYAYNLTADSLLWINTELDSWTYEQPLQVSEGIVLGSVNDYCFGIDLTNGDMLWKKEVKKLSSASWIEPRFDDNPLHVDNSRLIFSTDEELIFLNKSNGVFMGRVTGLPSGASGPTVIFENKLYYTSDTEDLVIVDLINFEILKVIDDIGKPFYGLRGGVTIDPIRRLVYVHDRYSVFCLEIDELLK